MSDLASTMPFSKLIAAGRRNRHNHDREQTNFLGAAKAGSTIRAETTPVHRGKRTSVWQTRITTADGKPVALVIQTQMLS